MTIDTIVSAGQLAGAMAPAAGTGLSTGMSAARALKGPDTAIPRYGLSMRFIVEFSTENGTEKLGEWSSCTGLQIEFEREDIDVGGDYGGKVLLPKGVKYGPVVLERAMERKPSKALQNWLRKLVEDWVNGASGKTKAPKGTVVITLKDCQQKTVWFWELRNAVPVSWSGPDMRASSDGIALEKLTLVHEGFLPHAGAPHKSREGNAQLSLGDERVLFHYNPGAMTMAHTAMDTPKEPQDLRKRSSSRGRSRDPGRRNSAENKTKITLDSVVFDGDDVEGICDRLIDWTYCELVPGKGPAREWLPPCLEFRWGEQKSLSVYLTDVTAKYTRFSRTGKPVRASVTLHLEEIPGHRPKNNPTSGGLPGRRTHMLTGAETLPGLATATYGGPGRWREIAAANGFDDPLRVRPGTAVYLPSAQEAEQ